MKVKDIEFNKLSEMELGSLEYDGWCSLLLELCVRECKAKIRISSWALSSSVSFWNSRSNKIIIVYSVSKFWNFIYLFAEFYVFISLYFY
jgi:hypothetical protein